MDLCSLRTIFSATRQLATRIPRLDVLICNAGIGGWSGLNWWAAAKQVLTEGINAAMTRPTYNICRVGARTQQQLSGGLVDEEGSEVPVLAEVFCANVFGHYVLAHEAMGLLSRPAGVGASVSSPGRVVWVSSLHPGAKYFDAGDIQGIKSLHAYESSKRLTDIMVLGASTHRAQASVAAFLTPEGHEGQERVSQDDDDNGGIERSMVFVSRRDASASPSSSTTSCFHPPPATVPPQMFVTHPGIFGTSIMPLATILVYLQFVAFYLARLFGNEWHVHTPFKGATSPVWLALESDEALEEADAEHRKWGSRASPLGAEGVTQMVVDGWGTAGESTTHEFEDESVKVWEYMEDQRKYWTGRVKTWEASS
jgi:3-keto steroid reductase